MATANRLACRSDRKRLGLLEKHKDYQLRAKDYHRKEDALKARSGDKRSWQLGGTPLLTALNLGTQPPGAAQQSSSAEPRRVLLCDAEPAHAGRGARGEVRVSSSHPGRAWESCGVLTRIHHAGQRSRRRSHAMSCTCSRCVFEIGTRRCTTKQMTQLCMRDIQTQDAAYVNMKMQSEAKVRARAVTLAAVYC
jgi:hypothetical protein